jgi:hypothetical protein
MKRWYLVCEEDSSVLYREVLGPFKSLADADAAIPKVRSALKVISGSDWNVRAERLLEGYALALSSEERIEEVK